NGVIRIGERAGHSVRDPRGGAVVAPRTPWRATLAGPSDLPHLFRRTGPDGCDGSARHSSVAGSVLKVVRPPKRTGGNHHDERIRDPGPSPAQGLPGRRRTSLL